MSDSKVVSNSGHRRPPNAGKGRKKGVPNRLTKGAKEAIQEAFKGVGGVAALQRWAKDNPEAFYTKVWVRILPQDVNAKIAARTMTPEEADAIVDEALGLRD